MTLKQTTGILLLFSVFMITVSTVTNGGESDDGIELNWKLAEGDTIAYETVMEEIGESEHSIDADGLFDGLFNDSLDSSGVNPNEIGKKLSESLRKRVNNTNNTTFLSNSPDFKDIIDVEMITTEKDESDAEGDISDLMSSMFVGTMLRGSIHKDGRLHSFWIKQGQKNLVSMFFELPTGKVKKGDSWKLENVNYIGNDQNFRCRKAEKRNVVTLSDIKIVNGEKIAVIEYDLYEFVSGDFTRPAILRTSKTEKPTVMTFTFKGKAEFSVDQGKWLQYSGILSVVTTGFMNANETQKIALVEQ